MKKNILFVLMIVIAFSSCIKDRAIESPENTVKLENVSYKMPIVTTNISEVKNRLELLTTDIEVLEQGNDIIVKAKLSLDEKNLFSSFYYTFLSGGAKGVLFTYKFNPNKRISLKMKRIVMHHINDNNKIII